MKKLIILLISILLFSCNKSSNQNSNQSSNNSYILLCDIGIEDYSISIEGESGALTITYNNESTQYGYNAGGIRETITLDLNRTLTYEDSDHIYQITGEIVVNEITQTVEWEIFATGGGFGDDVHTCEGP